MEFPSISLHSSWKIEASGLNENLPIFQEGTPHAHYQNRNASPFAHA